MAAFTNQKEEAGMELLNLDTLVKVERQVVLGGNSYVLAEQTIGMLLDAIETTKLAKSNDGDAMFIQMVKTAQRMLPDAPEQVIQKMNIDQLTALIEFGVASNKEAIDRSTQEEETDSEGKS